MYLACECVLSYCPCAGSRESEAPSGEFLLGTLNMEFNLGGITQGVLLRECYSRNVTQEVCLNMRLRAAGYTHMSLSNTQ